MIYDKIKMHFNFYLKTNKFTEVGVMNKKTYKKIISAICATVILFAGYLGYNSDFISEIYNDIFPKEVMGEGITTVEAIDVGQGDCFLVRNKKWGNILIDAGDNGYEQTVINALQKRGVKKLDYVIISHPHSDHIGGIEEVVKSFDIGEVYMPKVSHNTKTYEDTLKAIKEKGLLINEAYDGVEISLNDDDNIKFISPDSNYSFSDLNDLSCVFILNTQGKKILFTGDAGSVAEKQYMDKAGKVDILKAAHHGGYKGNSEELIKRIRPEYVLIGVGENNDYNHPNKSTLKIFDKYSAKVLRTDINGDILLKIENGQISVEVQKEDGI